MEIRDYLNVARRHWLLILAAVLVAMGVSAVWTFHTTPLYSSSARVFISTTPDDSSQAYQGSLFSEQRVKSYADIVTGDDLAKRVVKVNHLDISPAALRSKIQATVIPDSVLIQITVTDPNPRTAQRLNQGVVEELSKAVVRLETPPGKKVPVLRATEIDSPNLPGAPISPKPSRNLLLALMLGLLLGFGLAALREVLDTSVKEVEDVPELANTPLLAQMPMDKRVADAPLIAGLGTHDPRTEAFRVLRTNLQFVDVDSTHKALVFTSSLPGEGKSTTSVNTAIALAMAGNKVLLVDADLRRPQVARLLGLENAVGLTTALIGTLSVADAIQRHGETGLDVLTSGVIPPNPAELLQSQAMADLLERVRSSYDFVIFDAPPLIPVTDAALIAAQTDGAVLVVRSNKTTKDQVATAVHRLESVSARALGVVVNMVPQRRGFGSGYGYGYGYGYAPDAAKDVAPIGTHASSAKTRAGRRAAARAGKRKAVEPMLPAEVDEPGVGAPVDVEELLVDSARPVQPDEAQSPELSSMTIPPPPAPVEDEAPEQEPEAPVETDEATSSEQPVVEDEATEEPASAEEPSAKAADVEAEEAEATASDGVPDESTRKPPIADSEDVEEPESVGTDGPAEPTDEKADSADEDSEPSEDESLLSWAFARRSSE